MAGLGLDRAHVVIVHRAWCGTSHRTRSVEAPAVTSGALDALWKQLKGHGVSDRVTLIADGLHYKSIERWAFSQGLSLRNLFNTGHTLGSTGATCEDLCWCLRRLSVPVETMLGLADGAAAVAAAAAGAGGATRQSPPWVLVVAADLGMDDAGFEALWSGVLACRQAGRSGVLVAPARGGFGCDVDEEQRGRREETDAFEDGGSQAAPPVELWEEESGETVALGLGSRRGGGRQLLAAPAFLLTPASAAALARTPAKQRDCTRHLTGWLNKFLDEPRPLAWLVQDPQHVWGASDADGFWDPSVAAPMVAAWPSLQASHVVKWSSQGLVCHRRAYARVGLMGNPSDGFRGKTVAVTISNYFADAWVLPPPASAPSAASISLVPHPVSDASEFSTPALLSAVSRREGYVGGLRLMRALVHRFLRRAAERALSLPRCRNGSGAWGPAHAVAQSRGVPDGEFVGFQLVYDTNVPRQVGLAGSSAILTALLRGLVAYYGYEGHEAELELGDEAMASFVLAVEKEELHIQAGLQDRVAQSYDGLVYMDFSTARMEECGRGEYRRLASATLPPLFLAFAPDPSDSGRIHAPVRARWEANEGDVRARMSAIAACAEQCAELLGSSTQEPAATVARRLAALMRRNFDGRREIFGDAALGTKNLRMVEIAREAGAGAKFPGSGGAVVGVLDVASMEAVAGASADQVEAASWEARLQECEQRLKAAYGDEGFVMVRLQPRV